MHPKTVAKELSGFTLIEMLLVMVIISMIVYAGIGYVQRRTEQVRIDKATLQTQQILNAAMSYYVSNGKWPDSIATLSGNYLPRPPGGGTSYYNPWGNIFSSTTNNTKDLFFVWSKVNSQTPGVATLQAAQIANLLPLSYTSTSSASPPSSSNNARCSNTSTDCYAVASVNIPGRNLNNADAVTFAGIYHHGGCVPVPKCPVDKGGRTMRPQIFVVPVSVSGTSDATGSNSPNLYPIASFTAYVTPPGDDPPTDTTPPKCIGSTSIARDPQSGECRTIEGQPADAYWRVCLDVITPKGAVAGTGTGNQSWGRFVSVMAVTRCSIEDEPSGSEFRVYSN